MTVRGLAVIGLGISINLDELAIGFSLGLATTCRPFRYHRHCRPGVPRRPARNAAGASITERLRERAEQAAALALISLGAVLIIETFAS